MRIRSLFLSSALAATPAMAQDALRLPEISVLAGSGEIAPPVAASETIVSREEILATPTTRPGEILEQVPGLIVTQHSGEGKANQYFLRGFNLDHGIDLAITIDGMPANMRTHGHGQGYADVNFLIPELVQSMRVRKGPYFADEGDFSSAGAVRIDYLDRLDNNLVQVTGGSFGYARGLAAASQAAGAGYVTAAAEATRYSGPWDVDDNLRKLNGFLRYSQGTALDGFSITALAYSNRWTSTDQVAQRAIDNGTIGRFGSLDPTDGGKSNRFSLSGRWSRSTDMTVTKADAYVINSSLQLFNNFTYFLTDPVNGDQFSQTDRRTLGGLNLSHQLKWSLGPFASEATFGLQTRYDDIHVGLFQTAQRTLLSAVRVDHVGEGSAGFYAQNAVRWTDWLRTITGLRYDVFAGSVNSDTPENSGRASDGIVSPKASVIIGPFFATELFLNAGRGFHSNDLRGATINVTPGDPLTPLPRVPLLVRSQGGEIGVRSRALPNLDTSVAVFVLDYASELLFVGDAGTTEPSRPSRRVGVEWTNHYQPLPWLGFDVDVAHTRARFTDYDPAGPFIPGAATTVGSAAVTVGQSLGWFGTMKLRYFGPRPLIEDDSVRSMATTLVNARVGYAFSNDLRIWLDALNLFNAKSNQIDYFYESQLRGEAAPVADRHIHPVEPLALRLTLAARF